MQATERSATDTNLHPQPSASVAARRRATVGIVDDDSVLRRALSDVLTQLGHDVVATAATLVEARAVLAGGPEVLLLDLGLPDGPGIDLIDAARAGANDRVSETRIVVLTVFADVRSVVSAIEAGADGYLLKDSSAEQIADAIQTVLDGGAPLSPAVASHILSKLRSRKPVASAPVQLTARETAVLEALAKGQSFKEVARRNGISLHTVGDHVKAIYRKLAVNSRGEAVFKAIRTGIISVDR